MGDSLLLILQHFKSYVILQILPKQNSLSYLHEQPSWGLKNKYFCHCFLFCSLLFFYLGSPSISDDAWHVGRKDYCLLCWTSGNGQVLRHPLLATVVWKKELTSINTWYGEGGGAVTHFLPLSNLCATLMQVTLLLYFCATSWQKDKGQGFSF